MYQIKWSGGLASGYLAVYFRSEHQASMFLRDLSATTYKGYKLEILAC